MSRLAGIGLLGVFTLLASFAGLIVLEENDADSMSAIERCLESDPLPSTLALNEHVADEPEPLTAVLPLPMVPYIADLGVVAMPSEFMPWRSPELPLAFERPTVKHAPHVMLTSVQPVIRSFIEQGFGWCNDAMTHLVSTGCAYILFHRAYHLPWEFW